MTVHLKTWEYSLLSLAWEARHSTVLAPSDAICDEVLLKRAYAHCQDVTSVHSRSFYVASSFLPASKRRAVRALYAYCRTCDDLVDNPTKDPHTALTAWRQRVLAPSPSPEDLVAIAWADTRAKYRIPQGYAEQLIDGVARDLNQTRYENFTDLVTYAYGVASTVGLMSMHITGFSGPEAIPYAIKLGVALQITNILRDVGEDWRTGRVYLPLNELESFGLAEADLATGKVNDRWRNFMRFQIQRNRQLYAEAWPGIAFLDREGRLSVAAAARLYQAILDDIEAYDYDVFNRRAYVGVWGKLKRLPAIWWQTQRLSFEQTVSESEDI